MFTPLPAGDHFMNWSWPDVEGFFQELDASQLTAETIDVFLHQWAGLNDRLYELHVRLKVATTRNTADAEAQQRHEHFLAEVFPPWQNAEQRLREKLLASGLEAPGMEIALRDMRADVALFRDANIPLLAHEQELENAYYQVTGAETVLWDDREITLDELNPVYQEQDRSRRERAWRLESARRLQDREAIDEVWRESLALRLRMAANAGYGEYRSFRWQQFKRFDYTPGDCLEFHRAIEEVVVPVARRLREHRRLQLGVDTLRPWDLHVDPMGRPPLHPYESVDQLAATAERIFRRVGPAFGDYFATMRHDDLLDLDVRKNKAPGGYCETFPYAQRPFIFMRSVGVHDDVQTLLHEGGHAFHSFEMNPLPYGTLHGFPGAEFSEVASMGMELLASPYLATAEGGFYEAADAARARIEHLESIIFFWPYMAVVDAFQHWVYEHPEVAADTDQCGSEWARLWARFMPGVDWSGLGQELRNGWRQKLHIHVVPFYYVEYGMAQLGAVQIWANARHDQESAVARYRSALALGNTRPLPELFDTAGARFALDGATLQSAVEVIQETIAGLENLARAE
jgi:oligoendopeptidase F